MWQGVLAALFVAAIAVCAYAANSIRDVNLVLDAGHRARIALTAMGDDQRMRAAGKSFGEIAPAIVKSIDAERDMNAAIVDENDKLIAGDKTLLSDVVIPMGEKRGQGLPFPGARGLTGNAPPDRPQFGLGYGPGPSGNLGLGGPLPAQDYGFVVPPSAIGEAPGPSLVRLSGGWLVFAQQPNALGGLGTWYWPTAAALMLLAFLAVWSLGRHTLVQTARPMARVEKGLRRLVDVNNPTVEAIATDDTGLAEPLVESYNAAAIELAAILRQRSDLESRLRQFIADAGHELRTPLAVIMGYVQLLHQGASVDPGVAERVYSEIEGQGQRMTLLIQKLLLLTRLESQEARDIKVLDAGDVARSVAESFGPLAGDSKIEASVEPGALVKMSESEFRDVVGNLIDNALKYAPGSAVGVVVRATDGFVHVCVTDDGPGMSPELRARAFERFSRGETAGAIPGSGLGLAIVETAVQRAGGSLSLRTAVGKGTSVDLRFPASTEPGRAG